MLLMFLYWTMNHLDIYWDCRLRKSPNVPNLSKPHMKGAYHYGSQNVSLNSWRRLAITNVLVAFWVILDDQSIDPKEAFSKSKESWSKKMSVAEAICIHQAKPDMFLQKPCVQSVALVWLANIESKSRGPYWSEVISTEMRMLSFTTV